MEAFFNSTDFFPFSPLMFTHDLGDSELFSLDGLAETALLLPPDMIETNGADQDIPIAERIQNIQNLSSWIMFRNLEQTGHFKELMNTLLKSLERSAIIDCGAIFTPMCFLFLSSPNVFTPFHIDPEHNFLFQIKGSKKLSVSNELMDPIISGAEISDFYKNEVGYELNFKEEYREKLTACQLRPNIGVYIPATYAHLVENGSDYSVSFSLTFHTNVSREKRIKYLNL